MTKVIDALLMVAIILIGWFSISNYYRMESLPIKGGFLATHTIEILAYLAFVLMLILLDINRKFTYVIATPLMLVILILIPMGFFLG